MHMVSVMIFFFFLFQLQSDLATFLNENEKTRNVRKIFRRFQRHPAFMIIGSHSPSLTRSQPDTQTERTLFELFDKIGDVDGESEVWNQANIDQKHVYCSKIPE